MFLRLKILAAAVITCALAGAPGVVLAQDPNQTPPAQPAPAPTDSSTPASPPSSDTVQPNAPAPSPAVNPSDVTPAPGQPTAVEETVGAPGAGRRGARQFGEEIVVTGSRIRRKDLTTPAPVAVLSKEQIQASGKVSLGDFLQSLPEQGNALNTNVNNGGAGASRVDLRGLGNQRTLVLLNGRRMVGTGTGAVTGNGVDLNTIPIAAVERIEVLKDGASSVYGSDAISGVVNVITKRSYDGLEANVYEGISTHGDGNTVDVNVTAGTASEKGSFMFSGGFFDQQQVMAGDRPWSQFQLDYDFNGNVTKIGSSRVPDGRILSPNLPGAPPASSYIFDGTLPGCVKDSFGKPNAACFRKFNTAAIAPNGDLYNFQPSNYDVTPNRRVNLFSTGELKLGEGLKAFFEGSLTHRESAYQLAPEPLIIGAGGVDVTVSKDNFYNPFGKDFTQVTRRLVEFGPRRQSQIANTFRVVGGLNGELPFSWTWDAALIYGRTDWANINAGNVWQTRLQNAVGPSFLDPKTNTVTCGTLGAPIAGCAPLNLFGGAGSISPAAVKYLGITTVSSVTNELTSFQFNTAGELPVTLFADRPLALAVGYEYRFEQGSDTPDAITAGGEDSNGTRVATGGHFFTNEVYAELSIPIMNHVPGVENLEATASARIFDYSTFGTDWTYKFGGRYSPISDVTFRGTYSTAYRAPNIDDLFRGTFDNFPTVSDPCSNLTNASPGLKAACVAQGVTNPNGSGQTDTQLRVTNGGNAHLKPETAKTYTAGIVIEPSMVKNLSFTVDYYHIDITNAISTLGAPFILSQCYPTAGAPVPSACAAVLRDNASFITRINDLNLNVGGNKTAGFDVTARYSMPTEGFGRFGLGVDGNFLQFYDVIQPDGTVIHGRGNFDVGQANGGIQGVSPTFKGIASVTWGLGGLGAGGTVHYIGNIKQCAGADGTSTGGVCYNNPLHMERDVGDYATVDLFASYNLKTSAGTTSLAVGVNNLFDAAPRTIYGALEPNSDPTAYDFMGRFVYIRLGQRL